METGMNDHTCDGLNDSIIKFTGRDGHYTDDRNDLHYAIQQAIKHPKGLKFIDHLFSHGPFDDNFMQAAHNSGTSLEAVITCTMVHYIMNLTPEQVCQSIYEVCINGQANN